MTAAPATLSTTPASISLTTLVLGLGNPLLTDDSVGLRVVEHLQPQLAGRADIRMGEDYCGGLRLMERMIGFDRVILVDAICSGREPGAVCVLTLRDLPTRHSGSSHDADLLTAMALGRQSGARLPADENVRLVAIEAADVLTFGEECSLSVQSAIGKAAEAVLTLLAVWR
jgi:hydrogenase maturation protease